MDASQAFGKISVDVEAIGADYLVIAGHKFYGPRIGALYQRTNDLVPFLVGGGQESGRRSGTENTPMIVGLGAAAELVARNLGRDADNMRRCRDLLHDQLKSNLDVTLLSGLARNYSI